MEASKSSILSFTGNGDVQAFLAKIEIHAALKDYTGEKLVQALASKLEGQHSMFTYDFQQRMEKTQRN